MTIKIKTPSPIEPSGLNRRQFLKTGLLGGAVLSTLHLGACTSQALKTPLNRHSQSPYAFLTKADAIMLSALFPVMIADNWPDAAADKRQAEADTLQRIDAFLIRLGAFNQNEIRQLFDLLQMRVARGLATGIWRDWENTDSQQIEQFLQGWKHSSISLFNSGYNGLSDIICFAWYSHPEHTRTFGYSGPPRYVLEGLPQFQSDQENSQATVPSSVTFAAGNRA